MFLEPTHCGSEDHRGDVANGIFQEALYMIELPGSSDISSSTPGLLAQ
jgi:hypothetical protein